MDVKLVLTEKEPSANCADRAGSTLLRKMHTLGHNFVLNAQGSIALSAYDVCLAGKLRDFAYSEEKVEEAVAEPLESSSRNIRR